MKVRDIDADICREYAKERVAQGRSANTVWRELTRLRSCLNWAKAHNEIERKPYVWGPMKPKPEKKHLTLDQIHRLIVVKSSVNSLKAVSKVVRLRKKSG
jgi:site-specific recombinase XerD